MSKFSGDGFSRQPFEEDELARHREMFRNVESISPKVETHHVVIGKVEEILPWLETLVGILKSGKSLAVTFGVIGILAGGITYAVQMGFFQ